MSARRVPRLAAVGALAVTAVATPPAPALGSKPIRAAGQAPPAVVAITEPGGFNVLHDDFRAASPGAPLPRGVPHAVEIELPQSGSFADRVADARAGTLGHLEPDTLYHLRGTRILIYVPRDSDAVDIFEESLHATGTTSSAIGRKYGTAPHAYVVYVPRASEPGWQWLEDQTWIDVISTSYYPVVSSSNGRCHPAAHIRAISRQGRIVFAAAGNFEQAGLLSSPAGTPEAYQVGGADDAGRTYLPSGPENLGLVPTRPYESADRFDFPAADWQALSGSMPFGGTSGAAPSTAGRAATLIARSRALLHDRRVGLKGGALARAPGIPRTHAGGMLSDGKLTSIDLVDVLHQAAVPAEPASPFRYLAEGYGAHSEESIDHAFRILIGTAEPVVRPDEDAMHARVEAARKAVHSASCS